VSDFHHGLLGMVREISSYPNEEQFEVWVKDPSTPAFAELMNRALDKPAAAQQLAVDVSADWDKLAARLASVRGEPIDPRRFLGPPTRQPPAKG